MSLEIALRLFDPDLGAQLRTALPRTSPADVTAVGSRGTAELAAAGVATLDGRLGALIRPPALTAGRYAAACRPALTMVAAHRSRRARHHRTRRDGLPQPGGLTWRQLASLTATALATGGCAGWSVRIYNPDLNPGRDGADAIISYVTQEITNSDQRTR